MAKSKLKASQEMHIIALRKAGVGYRKIAEEMGLPRDTVRYFCKTHDLAGVGKDIAEEPVCLQCGGKLPPTQRGRHRKFCSDQCRWKWDHIHSEDNPRPTGARETISCACCGRAMLTYKSKKRRYCSHECYIRDRFWRLEDGREPYVPPKNR